MTRFYRATAQQNAAVVFDDRADHDFRIDIVYGAALVADVARKIVPSGGAPRQVPSTGRAEFHHGYDRIDWCNSSRTADDGVILVINAMNAAVTAL